MKLHFNLVDLVGPLDREIDRFRTRKMMHDYTFATKKYFAKKHALAGALLKFLLKEE
jgi:hypothetical protein